MIVLIGNMGGTPVNPANWWVVLQPRSSLSAGVMTKKSQHVPVPCICAERSRPMVMVSKRYNMPVAAAESQG